MATNTENYGFRKVGLDAAADIEAIEKNWDLADAELKRIEDETMHKEDFDPDGDGVVDNAAKLGGQSPEYYATKASVDAAVQKSAELEEEMAKKANASHTHASGDINSLAASKISAGTFSDTDVKAKSGTDYGTARVRNIKVGTADLTAGTSALTSGDIYFVYE